MYLNLGNNKKKRNWTSIDILSNADIQWNFESLKPLPFKNNSIEGMYCQNVFEHLEDKTLQFLCNESYRLLKPGGIFKVVMPDFDLFVNAYVKNNLEFFTNLRRAKNKRSIIGSNISEMFLYSFISYQILINNKRKRQRIALNDLTFKALIETYFHDLSTQKDIEKFIEYGKNLLKEVIKKTPTIFIDHKNACNFVKLKKFFEKAGFTNINKSSYKGSRIKQLNLLDKFPDRSMYVEIIK